MPPVGSSVAREKQNSTAPVTGQVSLRRRWRGSGGAPRPEPRRGDWGQVGAHKAVPRARPGRNARSPSDSLAIRWSELRFPPGPYHALAEQRRRLLGGTTLSLYSGLAAAQGWRAGRGRRCPGQLVPALSGPLEILVKCSASLYPRFSSSIK